MIDTMEHCDVATVDIPGAFMHTSIVKEVQVKFDKELINLLCQVDPSLNQYMTMDGVFLAASEYDRFFQALWLKGG